MTQQFANFAQGVLSAPITANQTTISITPTDYTGRPAAVSKFPLLGTFPIVVQSFDVTTQIPTSAPEIMTVTAVAGNTFTVTRGAESSTASAFASGAQVVHINTAAVMAALAAGASGVISFNTRAGAVTLSSSDVSTALGYTPQINLTLTTTGSSGAATLSSSGALNIPQYSGGSGGIPQSIFNTFG